MSSTPHYDVIIIGGGAAGFFSAIQIAESTYDSASILLLEKGSKTLTKVKISGGGRCNVTHACFEPKQLTTHYPRGQKSLLGPFHHFQPNHMIEWLKDKGVSLKTEADGRMFPITDDSQTIIDCLEQSAHEHSIEIKTGKEVTSIKKEESLLTLHLKSNETYTCEHLVIATGGTRLDSSSSVAKMLNHQLIPAVPSLFTFNIKDQRLDGISGLSVPFVKTSVADHALKSEGPILVTHWGLSGPAILKLSAWGARSLHDSQYTFTLLVDWSPNQRLTELLNEQRNQYGKRTICKRSPLADVPRRLWERLTHAADISPTTTWSQLTATQSEELINQVHHCAFQANGKSINKDEFVTCGGVSLKEINTKTFESKMTPNCYFTGEVLDIDGVTGGFNFQNAWTSSYLAAQAIAEKILS